MGEREIEVGTWARIANVSKQFRVLPNFHDFFYNVYGKNFFYKITRVENKNVEIVFFLKA